MATLYRFAIFFTLPERRGEIVIANDPTHPCLIAAIREECLALATKAWEPEGLRVQRLELMEIRPE